MSNIFSYPLPFLPVGCLGRAAFWFQQLVQLHDLGGFALLLVPHALKRGYKFKKKLLRG
jgi:hypothetical protein